MTSWQHTFCVGFAPQMSREELMELHTALDLSMPTVCHGHATRPNAWASSNHAPIRQCDPIIFGAWKLGEIDEVGQGEELFAERCFACDQLLGEPAGCRWFINWWDETHPATARQQLAHLIYDICFPNNTKPYHAQKTN